VAVIRNKMKFLKYSLPAVIYALLIFYLSSIPGGDLAQLFPYQDIVFHIIEYGIFAILISRAIKGYWPGMLIFKRILWTVAVVLVYAISDEFHQSFVPNRYPAVTDIAYDGIGAIASSIFYR